VATAVRNGSGTHSHYPPPPPPEWPLARRERYALQVLADVAAVQLGSLPERSLVRRLLEAPIHELDCWGTDPR
jgi:hypothetical protein